MQGRKKSNGACVLIALLCWMLTIARYAAEEPKRGYRRPCVKIAKSGTCLRKTRFAADAVCRGNKRFLLE